MNQNLQKANLLRKDYRAKMGPAIDIGKLHRRMLYYQLVFKWKEK